jgi:hypothetical protein
MAVRLRTIFIIGGELQKPIMMVTLISKISVT